MKISLNILMFIIVNWWEGREGDKERVKEGEGVNENVNLMYEIQHLPEIGRCNKASA